jgi:hypothetical protein
MAVIESKAFTKLKRKIDPICQTMLGKMTCGKKKLGSSTYVILHDYSSSEDPDIDSVVTVLKGPKLKAKVKDLPQALKDLKDPGWSAVHDAFEDAGLDAWEYVDVKDSEIRKALRELEKQKLAITHYLGC